MLNQSDMDKVVLEAKKSLSDEQIKEAIRKCSYGGSMVICGDNSTESVLPNRFMKGGDSFGKTNA